MWQGQICQAINPTERSFYKGMNGMIEIFIVTLLVFGLAMTGLAVGMFAGRRGSIRGCAAVRHPGDDSQECGACGEPIDTGGCANATGPSASEAGINQR